MHGCATSSTTVRASRCSVVVTWLVMSFADVGSGDRHWGWRVIPTRIYRRHWKWLDGVNPRQDIL
jgi:hypothetical protein